MSMTLKKAPAEGLQSAVTGTDWVHVTRMLYADDLTLTGNNPNKLQAMLHHLNLYACKEHLFINKFKSEVVHFNLPGPNLPVSLVGGVPLAHKGSNLATGFGRKAHLIPAGMYASQVWSTEYVKEGKELSRHTRRGACHHKPGCSEKVWACATAVILPVASGVCSLSRCTIACSNGETLSNVLKADLHSRAHSHLTAQEFTDNFRHRQRLHRYIRLQGQLSGNTEACNQTWTGRGKINKKRLLWSGV
eukprot:93314-Pelagomonas_calceolata.AAC.4